jgi:hypothetical protein
MPQAASMAAKSLSTDVSSVASPLMVEILLPSVANSFANFRFFSASRVIRIKSKPSPASLRASACPSPGPAPTTTAVPSECCAFRSSSSFGTSLEIGVWLVMRRSRAGDACGIEMPADRRGRRRKLKTNSTGPIPSLRHVFSIGHTRRNMITVSWQCHFPILFEGHRSQLTCVKRSSGRHSLEGAVCMGSATAAICGLDRMAY